MSKNAWLYDTEFGKIGIAEENNEITNVFFGNTVQPGEYTEVETPILRKAAEQLKEYLAGKRKSFDLPLGPKGTVFQKAVWNALLTIPCGETRTYKWLAETVGKPGGAQAAGQANGHNPISIFIPCHRVIGVGGTLTGYAGGLPMKKRLLELEGASL